MDAAMQAAANEVAGEKEPSRSMWTTAGPTSWPTPPALMSYTTLRDIEACPLRWGLRQGEYAGLWAGKGYPPAPTGATIAGQVVHVALERIVRAVSASRGALAGDHTLSGGDPMALVVEALRALGGISVVLEDTIRETVSRWESNPRLRPRMKEVASDLRRQVPALRLRVQHLLNRVDFRGLRLGRVANRADDGEREERIVRPLAPGLHAEVPLVNEELAWFGKADLLRVGTDTAAADGDEIVDFKTGSQKPDHAFQLRIYALLWAREKQRNPKGRRARRLAVLYDSGPVDVPAPITDDDLDGIANELAERTSQARAEAEQHPPSARPSREACEWCDVRQMCYVYWESATRAAIAPSLEPPRHQVDAGVQIVQRQGAWSWVALVREVGALSDDIAVGARLLLRARPQEEHFASLISAGNQLRIVGAQYVPPSEESGGLPVLSLTRNTEGFVLL